MNVIAAASTGGNYVALAYLVFVAVLALYLVIMANKLVKMQRTVSEIRNKTEGSQDAPS